VGNYGWRFASLGTDILDATLVILPSFVRFSALSLYKACSGMAFALGTARIDLYRTCAAEVNEVRTILSYSFLKYISTVDSLAT